MPHAEAVFDIDYFRKRPEPFYVLAKELYPGNFHPTISHVFLALLAKKGLLKMLFTQNIDCLEREAGVPADTVIAAHGSFASQRCIDCKEEYPDDEMRQSVEKSEVPRCKDSKCNGLVKPDIVFFGEPLPSEFRNNTFHASTADLALVIGTSLSVQPFASLPEMVMEPTPRVLFNMEKVGRMGSRTDDVLSLGPCDDGIRELAEELGWGDELEEMWRKLVGDAEADKQSRGRKKRDDEVEHELQKLTDDVEKYLNFDHAWVGSETAPEPADATEKPSTDLPENGTSTHEDDNADAGEKPQTLNDSSNGETSEGAGQNASAKPEETKTKELEL